MDNSRRDFIRNTGAFITLGAMGFSSKSYARIVGANDRITVGVMGTNGRGAGMAANFAKQANTDVIYICDVEEKRWLKALLRLKKPLTKSLRQ
jgi:hypothetical protein